MAIYSLFQATMFAVDCILIVSSALAEGHLWASIGLFSSLQDILAALKGMSLHPCYLTHISVNIVDGVSELWHFQGMKN